MLVQLIFYVRATHHELLELRPRERTSVPWRPDWLPLIVVSLVNGEREFELQYSEVRHVGEEFYGIGGEEAPRFSMEHELVQTGPFKLNKSLDGGRYRE